MKIDKILVPTDFSPQSDAALGYAVDLAERIGHRVILLHTLGPSTVPLLDGAIIPSAHELVERVADASEQIDALRRRFDRAGVSIEAKVVQGAPAEEIVRFADAERCDLIVMGTHGRSGLARIALGSVAERVVRAATIPVLTIRAEPPVPATDGLSAPVL